jgi:hypothetical protein
MTKDSKRRPRRRKLTVKQVAEADQVSVWADLAQVSYPWGGVPIRGNRAGGFYSRRARRSPGPATERG